MRLDKTEGFLLAFSLFILQGPFSLLLFDQGSQNFNMFVGEALAAVFSSLSHTSTGKRVTLISTPNSPVKNQPKTDKITDKKKSLFICQHCSKNASILSLSGNLWRAVFFKIASLSHSLLNFHSQMGLKELRDIVCNLYKTIQNTSISPYHKIDLGWTDLVWCAHVYKWKNGLVLHIYVEYYFHCVY